MIKQLARRIFLLPFVLLGINMFTYLLTAYLSAQSSSIFGVVRTSEVLQLYPPYLTNALQGDFGTLPRTNTTVNELIGSALPKSLLLLGLALLVSAVVGITAGFLSVNRRARRVNNLALILSLGGFSMPSFYFGIVSLYLMILLSAFLGRTGTLLPAGGFGLDRHLVLPTLVLAARPTAEIARVTAELLAEEIDKQYIRAARAKGLPWRLIMLRHAFRNIISAVIVTLGNSLRYVVSSLMVIEVMFSWPGIARVLIGALTGRAGSRWWVLQPPLVAGLMTVLALIFLLANLITELSAQVADPRLRRP